MSVQTFNLIPALVKMEHLTDDQEDRSSIQILFPQGFVTLAGAAILG